MLQHINNKNIKLIKNTETVNIGHLFRSPQLRIYYIGVLRAVIQLKNNDKL